MILSNHVKWLGWGKWSKWVTTSCDGRKRTAWCVLLCYSKTNITHEYSNFSTFYLCCAAPGVIETMCWQVFLCKNQCRSFVCCSYIIIIITYPVKRHWLFCECLMTLFKNAHNATSPSVLDIVSNYFILLQVQKTTNNFFLSKFYNYKYCIVQIK